jgi:hypothetical protein
LAITSIAIWFDCKACFARWISGFTRNSLS